MRRRLLLDILAVISLLLCVATAAMWVRSRSVRDEWTTQCGVVQRNISSDFGRIGYAEFRLNPPLNADYGWKWNHNQSAGQTVPVAGLTTHSRYWAWGGTCAGR